MINQINLLIKVYHILVIIGGQFTKPMWLIYTYEHPTFKRAETWLIGEHLPSSKLESTWNFTKMWQI